MDPHRQIQGNTIFRLVVTQGGAEQADHTQFPRIDTLVQQFFASLGHGVVTPAKPRMVERQANVTAPRSDRITPDQCMQTIG